jgi:hypothetical protein
MRTSSFLLVLPFVIAIGCTAPGERSGGSASGGSGGQTHASGGSGGSAGSGGTTSTGGSSNTGGDGSGGTTASGGITATGGDGSGGQGSGGSADASTTRPADAAVELRGGSGGGSGGAGSGGGSGAQTGGATGGGGSARGGSGGASTAGTSGRGGAGGTGGAGTGGATGTGGSTAPTACSFPSAWNPGSATYTTYSLPNAVTACGYNGSNNTIKNIVNGANFAAIPGQSSSNFDTSNRCGACVQIGNAVITIVDECPYDGSNNPPCKANPTGHLDLSNAGASAGGVQGDPNKRGQNQWKYIPCPVTGNVMVRLKPGNSNEMFIENEILPIASVTCGGQTGSRTSYGAWHFASNIPGASCTVTDIANRTITVTAGSTQGQDVDTGKQFPKCL